MQPVPPLDLERVLAKPLVRRRRPQLDTDVEVLCQLCGSLACGTLRRTGEQQRGPERLAFGRRRPPVQAAHDRCANLGGITLRHCRHRVVLVVEGDVVEDVGVLAASAVHPVQAFLHDRGDLVGERRVVCLARRHRGRVHERVTVLVLQTFAHQRRAAGSGTQQEAARAGVGRLPDEVADTLETEHRIERVERHRRVRRGSRRRCRQR